MRDKYERLFEQLYDTYYDNLYRYIYVSVKDKWNAEDIISSVFTKIYQNRDKIRTVEESKNWIFRIAHNEIIDFYRKNGKVILIDDFIESGQEDSEYDNVMIKDEVKDVKEIIDKLPEETKNIIHMKFYGELKYREIAEVLNKSENTIKTIVKRALNKIKISYENSMGGEIHGGQEH